MILRNYQVHAVEAILREFQTRGSTVIVLPTGTGKTIVFAHVIKDFLERGRVMVLAHRRELIEQAADKVFRVTGITPETEMAQSWANENAGFFGKPGIVVSSVQTQCAGSRGAPRMSRFNPEEFSLIVIDEFHHATAPMYRKIIEYYRRNPEIKILGCTATPDRSDEEALSQVCESVAFEYPIVQAMSDGWLAPIRQRMIFVRDLDFSGMRTSDGDLNHTDLAATMEEERTLHEVADPIFRESGNRATLVFCCSVKQAERMTEILNRHEPACAHCVHAKTPDFARREIFEHYKEGRFRFLVNVGITTEGWDEPRVQVVAMARPTKSRSLYAQMIGRGTRPLAGILDQLETPELRRYAIAASAKPFMEVIDFVGNSGRHKLIHSADILGGNISDDVRATAEKIMRASKVAIPTTDAIEQAKRHLAIEKAKRDDAEKRKGIVAKAKYTSKFIDPFAILDIEPAREIPRYSQQKELNEKQKKWLMDAGINYEVIPMAQSIQLLNEIVRRWREGLCTLKQAKYLKKYGQNVNMKKADAGKFLDDLWGKRK